MVLPLAEGLLDQGDEDLVPEVHVEQEAPRAVREDQRIIAQKDEGAFMTLHSIALVRSLGRNVV